MSNVKGPKSRKFAAFWVGPPLQALELLALKSFVAHGHKISLYVYDEKVLTNVPPRVEIKSAETILPYELVKPYLEKKLYGPASDYFAYKLMQSNENNDIIFTDLDTICLTSDLSSLATDYIVAHEISTVRGNLVNSNIFLLPSDSEELKILINKIENLNINEATWTLVGPEFLTQALQETGNIKKAMPVHIFYPILLREQRRSMLFSTENNLKEVLKYLSTKEESLMLSINASDYRHSEEIEMHNFKSGSVFEYWDYLFDKLLKS